MIALEEKSNSSLLNKNKVTFDRNRLRKLPLQQHNTNNLLVNTKQNPPSIEFSNVQDDLHELNDFLATYNIWIIMRMLSSDDQAVPRFSGWQLNNWKKLPSVNVKLEIGAPMNCYKLILNYQYYFSNVQSLTKIMGKPAN